MIHWHRHRSTAVSCLPGLSSLYHRLDFPDAASPLAIRLLLRYVLASNIADVPYEQDYRNAAQYGEN